MRSVGEDVRVRIPVVSVDSVKKILWKKDKRCPEVMRRGGRVRGETTRVQIFARMLMRDGAWRDGWMTKRVVPAGVGVLDRSTGGRAGDDIIWTAPPIVRSHLLSA